MFKPKSSVHICSLPRPHNSSATANLMSLKLRMEAQSGLARLLCLNWAEYRRPPCKNLSRFEGAGVYYGATFVEAQLCGGEEVIVVGGGNSACQEPCFWLKLRSSVHMLVRSSGLAESMSRYLIRRIEETATIVLRSHTEIVGVDGGDHLEFVRWHNNQTGQTQEHKIRHIFVMTGADPNTSWLDGRVALDDKGFIKTGIDLSPDNLSVSASLDVNHICLKPVCQVFLRWVMVRVAVSSVLHPQ